MTNDQTHQRSHPAGLDARSAGGTRGAFGGPGAGAQVGPLPPAHHEQGGDPFELLVADMRAAISHDFPTTFRQPPVDTVEVQSRGSILLSETEALLKNASEALAMTHGVLERFLGVDLTPTSTDAAPKVPHGLIPASLTRIREASTHLMQMQRLLTRLQEDV